MTTTPLRSRFQLASIAVGPAVAGVLAWLLSVPHGRGDTPIALANVGLALALVTVAFAIADWFAGAATSVVAALALNYFHTEPHRSFRISDRSDLYSVLLLLSIGFTVSAVTAGRVRLGITRIRHDEAQRSGRQLAEELSSDRPVNDVWPLATHTGANDLALITARLEGSAPNGLAIVGRDRTDPTADIPSAGATVLLHGQRTLVVTPRRGLGPVTVDRRALFSFADTIELALDGTEQPLSSPV